MSLEKIKKLQRGLNLLGLTPSATSKPQNTSPRRPP